MRSLTRSAAIGGAATAALLLFAGPAAASSGCSYVESTYSVTFTCQAQSTSYAVCVASATFTAYRGTPVVKRTSSFGGHATLSGGSLYLVRGSEDCTHSP